MLLLKKGGKQNRKHLSRGMMSSRLSAFRAWLLAPVGHVAEIKRRLVFWVLRTRLLFIVALLISIPTFFAALSATWRVGSGKVDATPEVLRFAAVGYWIIFALTWAYEYWYLRQRAGRKQSARVHRQKLRALSAQHATQTKAKDNVAS